MVLYLDERSSDVIVENWKQQASEDISRFMLEEGYHPHITLGACEDISLEQCGEALESFAAGTRPLTLEMPYIGIFPHDKGAVFLGVTMTDRLLAYHKSFHEILGIHGRAVDDIFSPGKWVPHCSMAYHESPEKDLRAIQLYMALKLPMIATCDRLAVIEFPPWKERLVLPLGGRPR
jgi:2'-5' RNA ligase